MSKTQVQRPQVRCSLAHALSVLDAFVHSSERGRVFGVVFRKRTNGEERHMDAVYRGTRRHLAGGDQAYNFTAKGLLPVADHVIAQKIARLEKKGISTKQAYAECGRPFRCIPKENIKRLSINGTDYIIV